MSDYPLDSPQQNLNWEQRQVGYDDGKTDNAGLTINPALSFPWPDDPDERVWTPVYMSLNEYVALLSAVDVGAAIAWTNDTLLVYYILVRNYSGGSMQFCEKLIDCITNDPDVREALVDALKNSEEFNQHIREQAGRSTGPQIEGNIFGGDCDEDVVAGNVIAIIDKMNTRNVDFLEIVEVGTNDEERVSAILSAIPVLGESPVDEIIDIIQGFLEDFTENYNAAITEDWLASVYGDLFCIALEKEDCSLTFQDIFDYFNARAGGDLTITSVVSNIFSFIVNGDFSTDNLVASGMYLIQLAFILAGLEFNGMRVPTMAAIARDASPSSAWMDWEPCPVPPPDGCTDFTSEEGQWHIYSSAGTYETGQGFKGIYYSGFDATALSIEKDVSVGAPDVEELSVSLSAPAVITSAYLYVNNSFQGAITPDETDSIVFSAAATGGSWPKGGDALYRIEIQAAGSNTWFAVEACLTYVAP